MNPHRRLLPLALAALFIVSCGGGGSQDIAGNASPVLQYQHASEELRLATLQVGPDVYPDVALRLAPDGNWALKSVGTLRPLQPNESPQAVLQAGEGTTLAPGWRPSVATITVRRLHIGSKVYGNVPLQLAGGNWFWGSARQAGDDTRDLHELKALSLADFHANPALAATDTHHTVLHSSPERRRQGFPMQLEAKRYRFCMGPQEEGADTVRLLDAAGATRVQLKAGDPCVELPLAAGRYTLQHEYGGSTPSRTVFVGPPAAPLAGAGAQPGAGSRPEYRAFYVRSIKPVSSGFLSFNPVHPPPLRCRGFIDPAAKALGGSYTRSTEGSLYAGNPNPPPISSRDTNYFRVFPTAGDDPRVGTPYLCRDDAGAAYWWDWSTGVVGLSDPPGPRGKPMDIFHRHWDDSDLLRQSPCPPANNCSRGILSFVPATPLLPYIDDPAFSKLQGTPFGQFGGLQHFDIHPDPIVTAARWFPEGLDRQRDAFGDWVLAPGEAALFADTDDCDLTQQGSVHVLKDMNFAEGMYQQTARSVQVGPHTVLTVTRGGGTTTLNQSGCVPFQLAAGGGMELRQTTQIDIHTNACEFCNLAGIDLSGRSAGLQGVKLQHANLADARFSNSDLSRADLRSATLQGAVLTNANLDGANLCNASLNGRQLPNGNSGVAAQLGGAHLRNVNLAGAQLDGTNFTHASFYSSSAGACVPKDCSTYAVSACATANGATANNASFVSAYLADADMTGLAANGADFSGAILFGARLVNARLNRSTSTGRTVSFGSALLHGADFSNAAVDYANFLGASVDADPANNCMQINLGSEYLFFPGFTVPSGANCVAPASVPAQSCVGATYGARVTPVLTNATNVCANGNQGPCLPESWGKVVKNTSTCGGTAPLCGNPFSGSNENTCWR